MEWDFLVRMYLSFALPLATAVVGLLFLRRSAANEEKSRGHWSALLITVMGLLLFLAHLSAYTEIRKALQLYKFSFWLVITLPLAIPFATTLFVATAPRDDVVREAFGIAILLGWVVAYYLMFS